MGKLDKPWKEFMSEKTYAILSQTAQIEALNLGMIQGMCKKNEKFEEKLDVTISINIREKQNAYIDNLKNIHVCFSSLCEYV